MPAGAVQDAARAAALEVLQELQQQGRLGSVVSLGSASSAAGTPTAGTAGSNGASRGGMIGAPKGYKGDPSDSRADAFKKMQVGAWFAKLVCLHAKLASILLVSCAKGSLPASLLLRYLALCCLLIHPMHCLVPRLSGSQLCLSWRTSHPPGLCMQELLKPQEEAGASQAGQRSPEAPNQAADTSQQATDDLVPISAWLGQQSEPMDRRIAEEALLAGAGYNEENQASLAASSGAGLAPGAAEGLASAPLQQSQQQPPQESASIGAGAKDSQAASGFSWQGDQQRRMASQGGMGLEEASSSSSSQESREGTVEYAPQQSGAGDRAQEVYGSAESRGIAGNATAGRSSEALQESGRWGAGEPAQNGEHRMPASQVEYVLKTSHAHQSLQKAGKLPAWQRFIAQAANVRNTVTDCRRGWMLQ